MRTRRVAAQSKVSRWRAAALIAVNLLIVGHVLHWWLTGSSMERLVLSDAAQTFEYGAITPGIMLFALALLLTVVAGRFFCGWACHMGALQDFCAYLLRRAGIRPRLFRARLLGYAPLLLAFYLFAWPSLKRSLLLPAVQQYWPAALAVLAPVPEFPGWSLRLTTTELWTGLPSPWIALPFLLLCGFATVYFLGARGLCRYGCPYAGLLLPAERLAPLRIVVDPARCDACGICNTVCTAKVNVLAELRASGAVADRNCVRSLDCLSACPQQALALRWSRPAALGAARGRPAARYDLSWREELLVAAVALATLLIARGLYGAIPLLLAASLGVLAGYLAWKSARLLRDPNAQLHGTPLKREGRLTSHGAGFLLCVAAGLALLLHSLLLHASMWQARRIDDQVRVPRQLVFTPAVFALPESTRERAAAAVRHYQRASAWTQGGFGLVEWPEANARRAWLHLVRGERGMAEAILRAELRRYGGDRRVAELARVMLLRDRPRQAEALLAREWTADPTKLETAHMLAELYRRSGRGAAAAAVRQRTLAAAAP